MDANSFWRSDSEARRRGHARLWSLLAVLALALPGIAGVDAQSTRAATMPDPYVVDGRTACSGSLDVVYSGLSGAIADRLEELQGKYEDQHGFRAVVFDGTRPAIIVAPETLSSWQTSLKEPDVRLFRSCVDSNLIKAAAEAIEGLPREAGAFATAGYSGLLDAELVDTSVDPELVVAAIEEVDPTISLSRLHPGTLRLELRSPEIAAAAGRYDDWPSYWGGARIYVDIGGGYASQCTTGFYINSATNGTVMVTAGHCSLSTNYVKLNGRTVWNGNWERTVGSTEGNKWPDPDLVVIDGQPYGNWSYSENDSVSADEIRSKWATPATGVMYCQFGAVTKRRCFELTSLNVTNCPPEWGGPCTTGLAYTYGFSGTPVVAQGDSGGGFYREFADGTIGARGIVHAGGCDSSGMCTGLFQRIQTVLSVYDATLP